MPRYTIRVYGLWINSRKEILISDERMHEICFTKFPGGGMEEGEGPLDCLQREWKEELNLEIKILDHYYTTDFYQKAAFHEDTQVLSLYYLVRPEGDVENKFTTEKQPYTFEGEQEEHVRWVALNELKPELLTFPIDQKVAELLQKENAR